MNQSLSYAVQLMRFTLIGIIIAVTHCDIINKLLDSNVARFQRGDVFIIYWCFVSKADLDDSVILTFLQLRTDFKTAKISSFIK